MAWRNRGGWTGTGGHRCGPGDSSPDVRGAGDWRRRRQTAGRTWRGPGAAGAGIGGDLRCGGGRADLVGLVGPRRSATECVARDSDRTPPADARWHDFPVCGGDCLRDVPDARPARRHRLKTSMRSRQRSQAVVEFGIIAITFTLIMFAIADFGLLLNDWLAVSSGSRTIARDASLGMLQADLDKEAHGLQIPGVTADPHFPGGYCCST